jgi:putative DNA methylase
MATAVNTGPYETPDIRADENPPPKAWRSRGYLPHIDKPGSLQAITFRLHDSVPEAVAEKWKMELESLAGERRDAELRKRMAKYEDAGHGACWLRQPDIAELVENALLRFDNERYRMIAWCVMPNHVHALIETFAGRPMDRVVHTWKSFTASKANKLLGRTGPFWLREYYDRFIRDRDHLAKAIEYIHRKPVSAGLVKEPGRWRFGSAARK